MEQPFICHKDGFQNRMQKNKARSVIDFREKVTILDIFGLRQSVMAGPIYFSMLDIKKAFFQRPTRTALQRETVTVYRCLSWSSLENRHMPIAHWARHLNSAFPRREFRYGALSH